MRYIRLFCFRSKTGLVLPRLKYEHVQLTSFSMMRVDLAAQVRYLHEICDCQVKGIIITDLIVLHVYAL